MKFMTTTALAIGIAASGAYAAEHQTEDEAMSDDTTEMATDTAGMQGDTTFIRTRDITGGNIYTTADATDWVEGEMYDGVGDGWNNIGEIEDIVLNQNGQMVGIVAEIGGFLDIADKHVMIEVNNVNLVAVDDATYAYVTNHTEEELEQMNGVDEGFWN